MNNDNEKYNDIINMPHHISKKHPQMSIEARSAQFAPFAALTGYEEAVKETARLTNEKIEIDEGVKEILNLQLNIISNQIANRPKITVTYFIKDDIKKGGEYQTLTGNVIKIDSYNKVVVFINGIKVQIDDIIKIDFNYNM